MPRHRNISAFTLIELLITIVLMGILVAAVLPLARPSVHEQLRAVAQILHGDLAHARSMAVTHNSKYRIVFDTVNNRYILEHSGTNTALDTLPPSPFREAADPSDQYIVALDELPGVSAGVSLATVTVGGSPGGTNEVEFSPLGGTTESQETMIWLGVGSGDEAYYVPITVNPTTGLTDIGDYTDQIPGP